MSTRVAGIVNKRTVVAGAYGRCVMKPIRIGRFIMFDAPISVWLDPEGVDGTVCWKWNHDGYIKMMLPGAVEDWHRLVKTTLHECVECATVLRRCQFRPCGSLTHEYHAADQYMMVMRHHEFTEIIEHAGDMLTHLLPEIRSTWEKIHRRPARTRARIGRVRGKSVSPRRSARRRRTARVKSGGANT